MIRQLGLFPQAYARRTDPKTSHDAAVSMEPHLSHLESRVLGVLRAAGERGATTRELEHLTGLDFATVTPRIKPLCAKGYVKATKKRRAGPSGRSQIVWVAT